MAGSSPAVRGCEAGDYSSAAKSVVIGETIRRELFGDEDPLGQSMRIGKVPFRVVGVLAEKGQGGFGQDQDDVVMVPLETARRRLSGASGLPPGTVQQIALGVARSEDLAYVQEEVEALLRERHRIPPAVKTISPCATSPRSSPPAPRPRGSCRCCSARWPESRWSSAASAS